MTNAELLAKIKAEIERRKKALRSTLFNDEYNDFLSFLSTLESEQPVPKDLEEAAHLFSESPEPLYSPGHRFHWDDDALFGKQIEASFIAGAKWQADHTPLPEDTVLFNKGVAEGKRLMMEDAVAVEVVGDKRDLRLIDSTQRCLFNAKRGDWLKIIIVNED